MPVPRHSVAVSSVQLPVTAQCDDVTELRVHGVGGTPPDAVLGDLAPEQVSGDATAGFYRSSDHRASDADRKARRDVDRHVEVYSWGGLTSRSKLRVLWLALLPFLFANLAGWMCSAATRNSPWRFRLHRLAGGLGALALTVNAALIAVIISADVVAYQTARAGLARHQWWLAPLGWHFIAGNPARQVMLGVLAPTLLVLALVWLASTTWRYEAVRPPRRIAAERPNPARRITAAALKDGLASDEFWDGESSVKLITWLHVAVVAGFLAIVLGVTTKALAVTGSPHVIALGWIAIGLGGATVALGVGYLCLDALDAMNDELRRGLPFLLAPGGAALIAAGLFAWLQPAGPAPRAAELPAMTSVIGWTTLAIVAFLVVALVSMLLGLAGSGGTLIGGPWITLMLAFSMLNTLLLGAEIWVAHLVGPVTSNAADALTRPGKIYLPGVVASAVPLVAWATLLAVLAFALVEGVRWLGTRRLPAGTAEQYQGQTATFRTRLTRPRNYWYWSGLNPFSPTEDQPGDQPEDQPGDPGPGQDWEQKIARAQFLGGASHDATWLLWGIIIAQLVVALCAWRLHIQPPVVIRNIGVLLIGLVLPALMAFLYSAWSDLAKRRTIGVLWDVGTFWPRSYHPLSPPCYTERAVPELQRRMWWLHDNGGRVTLVAHSQGAVLATAALVQPGCRPKADYPALVTFGSPVCKLYSWGFPAYLDGELIKPLEPGGQARLRDWRNFYYPTDPIGGPVAADLSRADGSPVDQRLLDPAECYYVYGQPPPSAQGHSGYWADPRVWIRINQIAAGGGGNNPADPAPTVPPQAEPPQPEQQARRSGSTETEADHLSPLLKARFPPCGHPGPFRLRILGFMERTVALPHRPTAPPPVADPAAARRPSRAARLRERSRPRQAAGVAVRRLVPQSRWNSSSAGAHHSPSAAVSSGCIGGALFAPGLA